CLLAVVVALAWRWRSRSRLTPGKDGTTNSFGTMPLDEPLRQKIDNLVREHRVLLFMKGNRRFPQCGFSQTVVGILDQMLPSYETVNVLADAALRDGIKEYSQWPTIPQLYIDGKFVGGCDIVRDLHGSGELARLLGAEAPVPDADET